MSKRGTRGWVRTSSEEILLCSSDSKSSVMDSVDTAPGMMAEEEEEEGEKGNCCLVGLIEEEAWEEVT